jgi:hypothetical protein
MEEEAEDDDELAVMVQATEALMREAQRIAAGGESGKIAVDASEDTPEATVRRIELLETVTDWMDLDGEKMQHVGRFFGSVHGRPLLSPRVKAEIYALHRADEATWTVLALSRRFQMSAGRVRAILMHQATREAHARQGRVVDPRVEDAFIAQFGVVDRIPDKTVLSPVAHKNQRHGVIEEDAHQPILTELIRKQGYRAPTRLDLMFPLRGGPKPGEPAPPPPATRSGRNPAWVEHIKSMERKKRAVPRPRMLVEKCHRPSGLHASNADRVIIVEDGASASSHRAATWAEREWVTRLHFLHRLPKGHPEERRLWPGQKSFLEDPTFEHPDVSLMAEAGVVMPEYDIFSRALADSYAESLLDPVPQHADEDGAPKMEK